VAVASLKDWLDISHEYQDPDIIVWYSGSPSNLDKHIDEKFAALADAGAMPPVVLLSETEDADEILAALEKGAKGVIPTSASLSVMINAMRLVRAGGTYVPAGSLISARTAAETRTGDKKPRNSMFTERQESVIKAIRRGKANKIIAYELNMQESTVKVHVRNIMRKLKATNRTEVAYLTRDMFADE
jgi:DNA-binding NarL/FixJ family response regulator